MKHLYSLLRACSAILLAVVSCQVAEPVSITPENNLESFVTLSAGLEDNGAITIDNEETIPETKTVRQSDGTVWWNPGDAISLFFGANTSAGGNKFTSLLENPAPRSDFSGKIGVVTGGSEDDTSAVAFWGVYPYNTLNTCNGSTVTLPLPANQVSGENTFSNGQWPTVAKSENLFMSFMNVGCGYKFTIATEGVTKVVFTTDSTSRPLAGNVTVRMDSNGKPEILSVANPSSSVTVTPPGGGTFKTSKATDNEADKHYYYAVMIPGNFKGGIKIEFYTINEKATYTCSVSDANKEYPSKRGAFKKMENKDEGLLTPVVASSAFQKYLGKTDAQVQSKMDALWDHFFVNSSNKIYNERSDGSAYILDTSNNDVRSQGMAWGMMICVQTNHKDQFDKLWKFAKTYMLNTSGQYEGNFSWHTSTSGTTYSSSPLSQAELYFATSLLFASHRWGNAGTYNYNNEAQYILSHMWKKDDNGNITSGSLFDKTTYVIVYQPIISCDFSNPSYDLPVFLDLFALWSDTNKDLFARAATAARNHLYNSSNSSSGLFTDLSNFDGSPKSWEYNSDSNKYMYDAMQCAMNFGMDYYLTGTDKARQTNMAKRLINTFEKDGYEHGRFNWDGSGATETYTQGEKGANAVACFALMDDNTYHDIIVKNLQTAWNESPLTGQYRYYDGLVYYLSMLHLTGNFKIWEPAN